MARPILQGPIVTLWPVMPDDAPSLMAATVLLLEFAFGPLDQRRDALWWDGAWHGAVTMAILAPEWRARSRA
jgi:hypothetical protein